jgi:nucleotide-binding universal stress UspA family protein
VDEMESTLSTGALLPKKILVGLDGSAGSARALAWAIELARAVKAEIVAVHVVELLTPSALGLGLAPIDLPDDWVDDLKSRFENEWTAPLKQSGVRYRTVFERGVPAPTLIAIAQEQHPDLIVTGSRGLGGFSELLLGSVSHQLVLHAQLPVVVIPTEHKKVGSAAQTPSEPASVAAP